jgi:putative DNA primase/helicase
VAGDAHTYLCEIMEAEGLTPPSTLELNGRVHRYCGKDERNPNTWVKGYDNGDGTAGGRFGNWRLGIDEPWFFRPASLTRLSREELEELRRRNEEKRKRAEEARIAQFLRVSATAAKILRQASPARPDHPYLVGKGVLPFNLHQSGESLLVPVRDTEGVLWSLQFIDPSGLKRFLSGGRISGCYHSIGSKPVDVVLVAEGFATAATLCEATGYPVAIAFNAGNMLPVSQALRTKYPSATLLICADDDRQTPGNPGMTAAHRAADMVGGVVVSPDFTLIDSTAEETP